MEETVKTNAHSNESNRELQNAEQYWNNATRRLTVGVAFATGLLLLYNVLLLIKMNPQEGGEVSAAMTSSMAFKAIVIIFALVLAFFCTKSYSRGLSRFATILSGGGKRSLYLIRWGFHLTVAGIILQLAMIAIMALKNVELSFLHLLISNALLVAATVVGSSGFLSLATSKGMPDEARRGALHMAWTNVVLLIGAFLLSYAVFSTAALRVATLIVNIFGACLFYINWRRILRPTKADVIEPEVDTKSMPNEQE